MTLYDQEQDGLMFYQVRTHLHWNCSFRSVFDEGWVCIIMQLLEYIFLLTFADKTQAEQN